MKNIFSVFSRLSKLQIGFASLSLIALMVFFKDMLFKNASIVLGLRTADTPYGHFEKINGPHLYRRHHGMHLLPDGKVLIAGGRDYRKNADYRQEAVLQAELYDPKTRSFSLVGKMLEFHECSHKKYSGCGISLPNGQVLFLGYPGKHIEIYNPELKIFQQFSSFEFSYPLSASTSILIDDNTVLVIGGAHQKGLEPIRGVNTVYYINLKNHKINSFLYKVPSERPPTASHVFPVKLPNAIAVIRPLFSTKSVNDMNFYNISDSFLYNSKANLVYAWPKTSYYEQLAKLVFNQKSSCYGYDHTYYLQGYSDNCPLILKRFTFYSEGGRTPVLDWLERWIWTDRHAYLNDLVEHKTIELDHPLTRAFSDNTHVILPDNPVLGVSGDDAELFIH
jgi:hypothetical protein